MFKTKVVMCTFIMVLALFSCSFECGRDKSFDILLKDIDNKEIVLNLNGNKFYGCFSKNEEDGIFLSLKSNNLQSPVKINLKDSKTSIDFEITKIIKSDRFNFPYIIMTAFDYLIKGKTEITGNIAVIENHPFLVKIDLQEEEIRSLYFPSGSIKFSPGNNFSA